MRLASKHTHICCSGAFILLRSYLNDLELEDLFSDHVMYCNSSRNRTQYFIWTPAALTCMRAGGLEIYQ